jgi:hypothetical protein
MFTRGMAEPVATMMERDQEPTRGPTRLAFDLCRLGVEFEPGGNESPEPPESPEFRELRPFRILRKCRFADEIMISISTR